MAAGACADAVSTGVVSIETPALQNTMVGDLVWLFCVLLVLTLVGRAAFVFPLSLLHNWYAQEQLSFKEMIVIWCASPLSSVRALVFCRLKLVMPPGRVLWCGVLKVFLESQQADGMLWKCLSRSYYPAVSDPVRCRVNGLVLS